MHEFRGALRRPNNLESALNTPSKELFESDFQQDQRQKYERSEHSYAGSRGVFEPKPSSALHRDNKQVFDSNIPVKVKSFERDDFTTYLRMQLLSVTEKSGSTLKLNLTDDSNHLFLWSFVLKESDYMALRNQQKIKIDFSGFPDMLVQHFEFLENEKDAASQTFFYSVFDIRKGGEATLTILQSNKFKESCHLALKFKMATDEQIKNYLSEKLTKEKTVNEELAIENSKLKDRVETYARENQTLKATLRQCEGEHQKKIEGLQLNEQKRIQELRQNNMQRESQLTREYEQEKKASNHQHEQNIRELNDQLARLKQKEQQNTERIYLLESKERELTSQLGIKESEVGNLDTRLKQALKKNQEFTDERLNLSNRITELHCTAENLKRELSDKLAIIESNQELKTNVNSQVQSMTEKAEYHKNQADKLQSDLEKAKAEIAKFMNWTEELKEKNQLKKDKLNKNKEIIKNQEKRVNELEDLLTKNKYRESEILRQCEDLKKRIKELQTAEAAHLERAATSKKLIEENNVLITHLNRQLNDKTSLKMQPSYVAPSYPISRMPAMGVGGVSGMGGMGGPTGLQTYNTETTISGSYQGTSRLRNSTSPLNANMLEKTTEKLNPQIKRYQVPRENFPAETSSRLNQQKDPDEMQQTLPTDTSSKIRPVRFRGEQPH